MRKNRPEKRILIFSAMMATLELNHSASVGGVDAALAAPYFRYLREGLMFYGLLVMIDVKKEGVDFSRTIAGINPTPALACGYDPRRARPPRHQALNQDKALKPTINQRHYILSQCSYCPLVLVYQP